VNFLGTLQQGDFILQNDFEQIREQIHEIRNFLGPLDLKLESLDHQISKSRISFELKTTELESRITEHSSELALHSDQIRQIQLFLKMPQSPAASMLDHKPKSIEPPPLNPPAAQ